MIERPPQSESPSFVAASPLAQMDRHIASWDWSAVTAANQHLCRKGSAQHGLNPRSHPRVAAEWEVCRACPLSLMEVLEHLLRCHRREPFFFFNESTFSHVSRNLGGRVFASLPVLRRRETVTAIVRYVAGLMERSAMVEIVETMWRPICPEPGDRVRTIRGSLVGTVLGIGLDGRIHWQPDCASVRVMTLPELLLRTNFVATVPESRPRPRS
jgi:hypothetical protein